MFQNLMQYVLLSSLSQANNLLHCVPDHLFKIATTNVVGVDRYPRVNGVGAEEQRVEQQ
jgi:hypothetical protein